MIWERRSQATVVAILLCEFAGCASHRPPVVAPATITATRLEIRSVSPSPGDTVGKKTVIVAELAYAITDFAPAQFEVGAQVETSTEDLTTDGTFPSGKYPVLRRPAGELTFSFPIAHVWDLPEVKRPLSVWFYLTKKTGPGTSLVVARAGPISYKTP